MLSARLRWAAEATVVALVYYAAARLGLLLQLPGTNASPVWPPSGIGLAAVLVFGLRVWPGIAVGAFLANLFTLPDSPAGFIAATAICVGNTLEHIAAWLLIRRLISSSHPFERARHVFWFVVAAALSCGVASTTGVTSLWLTGIIPTELYGAAWLTWWLGDTAGMLVLAPAIYCWWRAPKLGLSVARALELVALIALTLLTAELLFGGWVASAVIDSLPYLVVPSLVWAAFRFGPRETASLAVLQSAIAVWHTWGLMGGIAQATIQPETAFALFVSPAITANDSLLMLQIFVCAVAATAVTLAAAVAERTGAEAALRDNEARYHGIFQAAAVSIWEEDFSAVKAAIDDLRAHGVHDFQRYFAEHPDLVQEMIGLVKIVDVNDETLRLFGARDKRELLESLHVIFVPETHDVFAGELLAIAEGRSSFASEAVVRTVHGQRFDVLVTITFPPVTPTFASVLVSVMDITERKRAEEALRENVARLRLAQQVAGIGTFEWNIQTGVNRWTPELEAMYGLAPGGFAGTQEAWEKLVCPDDRAEAVRRVQSAMGKGGFEGEWRVIWPDGAVRWLAGRAHIFNDEAGKPLRLIGVNIDITERKRAEEEIRRLNAELEQRVRDRTAELEAANKELEAFGYSVSHDLRAPLRAVDGFSRILLAKHPGLPAEALEFLHLIRANTQQMGRLIDDLLTFARLSRQPVRKQRLDPAKMVRECLVELGEEQARHPVEITVHDLPPCHAEPSLLKQVWLNLLANALKYTRKRAPAKVEIACREQDGEPAYFVQDNGVGFDMRYAHKLFGVFQRLHRAEDYEGTGVGLAIVQRIVHRHGGKVWAESRPDQGAAFYFTLGEGGSR